jgi:hypothetical protein
MEDFAKDNEKNIFVIKQRLSEIQLKPGESCYHFYVEDKFIIKIWTKTVKDNYLYVDVKDDRITLHEKIHVNLYEMKRYSDGDRVETYIDLEKDGRFKEYKPIKYHQLSGYSSGDHMPVITLCELIKYLYRLSNLTAFL